MKHLKLRFERDDLQKQLPHSNSTSTDAIGAVRIWADPEKGRSYETLKDKGEDLEVIIAYSESDEFAENELVTRCRKLGIDCYRMKV